MKTLRSLSLAKILVLALGVVAPVAAHAQNMAGKFTLTHETHWGPAVLPAGDYEFRLESTTSPARILVRKDTGNVTAMLISMSFSPASSTGTSQLNLVDRGGDVFVSSMFLKEPGLELYFAVPKSKATEAPQTAGLRPPSMSGSGK